MKPGGRHIGRRILDRLTLVSLLVGIVFSLLLVRSYCWASDSVAVTTMGRSITCVSSGAMVAVHYGYAAGSSGAEWQTSDASLGDSNLFQPWWIVEFRVERSALWTRVFIGDWGVIILSSVLPVGWFAAMVRRRMRPQPGMCVKCGYDLRASKGACPECGEPVAERPVV